MNEMTEAVSQSRERAETLTPRVAVVLGSGFNDHPTDAVRMPYAELPGFPVSYVAGHSGESWLGSVSYVPVAVMSGRPFRPSPRRGRFVVLRLERPCRGNRRSISAINGLLAGGCNQVSMES